MPVPNHTIKRMNALIVNEFRIKFSFCRLHQILIVRLLVNRFSNCHEFSIELESDLLVTSHNRSAGPRNVNKNGIFLHGAKDARSKRKKNKIGEKRRQRHLKTVLQYFPPTPYALFRGYQPATREHRAQMMDCQLF